MIPWGILRVPSPWLSFVRLEGLVAHRRSFTELQATTATRELWASYTQRASLDKHWPVRLESFWLLLHFIPFLTVPSKVNSDTDFYLVFSWLFATPWITAWQASLSITNSLSSPRLTSIESVMPSSHLILCSPLLLPPPILPASESFPMSQLFTWGGQSTGVSALASFLPKNTQDWSPSEWTGWISLQSKGLSRVFFNITIQKHQFFGTQPSSQSNSHINTWPLEKL